MLSNWNQRWLWIAWDHILIWNIDVKERTDKQRVPNDKNQIQRDEAEIDLLLDFYCRTVIKLYLCIVANMWRHTHGNTKDERKNSEKPNSKCWMVYQLIPNTVTYFSYVVNFSGTPTPVSMQHTQCKQNSTALLCLLRLFFFLCYHSSEEAHTMILWGDTNFT